MEDIRLWGSFQINFETERLDDNAFEVVKCILQKWQSYLIRGNEAVRMSEELRVVNGRDGKMESEWYYHWEFYILFKGEGVDVLPQGIREYLHTAGNWDYCGPGVHCDWTFKKYNKLNEILPDQLCKDISNAMNCDTCKGLSVGYSSVAVEHYRI